MGASLLASSGEIVCVSPQCEVTTWCSTSSAKAFRPSGEPFSASPPDRAKVRKQTCILPQHPSCSTGSWACAFNACNAGVARRTTSAC